MNTKRLVQLWIRAIALIWFLLFFGEPRVWACSCIEHEICDPHFYADVDFIGEVLSKAPVPPGGGISWWHQSVRIRVVESFRGIQKPGDIVDVRTGMGGGDCGFHFEVGKQYLIDAWDHDGVLNTGICSRTASLDRGHADLRILRRIASHQPLPQFAGELLRMSEPEGGTTSPLGGVAVTLRPETGGASSTVIADTGGYFEFDRVPQGRYRLSLNLPTTLSVAFSNLGKVINESIPPVAINASGQTVCRMEIMAGPSASISGSVHFPDGKKAEGWVKADTVTSNDRPWNTVLTSVLEPSGSFQLAHLKPGRYLVQFTRKQGFVQGEAQIIQLREGERKTGIVLIAK